MKINNVEFIKSITNSSQTPEDNLPRFLLMGRSNVGKSSFINTLTNRKSIARISRTPGKTITLNFYLVENQLYLVDAPGYGYARRSKAMQSEFITMIDSFINHEPNLVKVFHLIDFKIGPTKEDLEVSEYLQSHQLNVVVICTKHDKVSSTNRHKQEQLIKQKMQTSQIRFTSSSKRSGFEKVYQELLLSRGEE